MTYVAPYSRSVVISHVVHLIGLIFRSENLGGRDRVPLAITITSQGLHEILNSFFCPVLRTFNRIGVVVLCPTQLRSTRRAHHNFISYPVSTFLECLDGECGRCGSQVFQQLKWGPNANASHPLLVNPWFPVLHLQYLGKTSGRDQPSPPYVLYRQHGPPPSHRQRPLHAVKCLSAQQTGSAASERSSMFRCVSPLASFTPTPLPAFRCSRGKLEAGEWVSAPKTITNIIHGRLERLGLRRHLGKGLGRCRLFPAAAIRTWLYCRRLV